MTTISKEIAAGKSKKGDKEWTGGTIKFSVDFFELTREELETVAYNSAKDHLQYGASTLWRNSGGELKDSDTGRFLVADGVVSFNPAFRVGEHQSKKETKIREAIEAQYELVASMTGAELTDEQKKMIADTVRTSMA